MKSSLLLMVTISAGLTVGFISTSASRGVFHARPALADDDNAEYEAQQAGQRDEDAEQQERYQQEQEQQRLQQQQEQNDDQREQEEQRHQEEIDRLNGERQDQSQ